MKPPLQNCHLMLQYLACIRVMRACLKTGIPEYIARLDAQRQKLHDQILQEAGVTRDNVEFACQLASWVDAALDAEAEIFKAG